MSSDESSDGTYGPPLPARALLKGKQNPTPSDDSEDDDAYMPVLPPHLLKTATREKYPYNKNIEEGTHKDKHHDNPKGTKTQESTRKRAAESDSEDDDDDDMYTPALPPHLLQKQQGGSTSTARRAIVGPTLPVGFMIPQGTQSTQKVEEEEEEEEEEEDEDEEEEDERGPVIGPAPPTEKFSEEEYRIRQLELRAKRMKDKLEGKDMDLNKPMERESWMLELPEDKSNICGLAPRQFLRKTPKERGDRSVWTDTPADKARKAEMAATTEDETPEAIASSRRDEELTAAVENYNESKRAKPLIDLHQTKLKKQKVESGPKERKPFTREDDLNVNKFDEAQRSNILKKARQLNDRFSAGNRKFL